MLLKQDVEKSVARIGSLCILILIEALNMESLEEGYFDKRLHLTRIDRTESAILKDQRGIADIDKEFSNWGAIPQHGPVLLAWAAFTQRVPELTGFPVCCYVRFCLQVCRNLIIGNMGQRQYTCKFYHFY
jgi:hypothetical protein